MSNKSNDMQAVSIAHLVNLFHYPDYEMFVMNVDKDHWYPIERISFYRKGLLRDPIVMLSSCSPSHVNVSIYLDTQLKYVSSQDRINVVRDEVEHLIEMRPVVKKKTILELLGE